MFQSALLNTGSSVIYFFLQWLTTVLAVRFADFESAGIYSLTISYINLFYYLALFGIRQYQISDVDKRFSDGQYFAARLTAAAFSAAVFTGATAFSTMSDYRRICSAAYLLFKLGEAFTDGYFSLLQLREAYLRLAYSYIAKGCISTVAFAAALYFTHDLFTAMVWMTAGYGVCILTLDVPHLWRMRIGKPIFKGCARIFEKCAPLMLVSLSVPAMNYMTRHAVEAELGNYLLGQYTSLSYVIVVMSTFASAVFIVFVPKVSQWRNEGQWSAIRRFLSAAVLLMVLAGTAAMAAGKLFGSWVCAWLFGKEILESIDLLPPLILTAALLMGKSFFSTMLVPFDHRWVLLAGECCGVILCGALAIPLTRQIGMNGANLSYLSGVVLQAIILGGCLLGDVFRLEIKAGKR